MREGCVELAEPGSRGAARGTGAAEPEASGYHLLQSCPWRALTRDAPAPQPRAPTGAGPGGKGPGLGDRCGVSLASSARILWPGFFLAGDLYWCLRIGVEGFCQLYLYNWGAFFPGG